MQQQHPSHPPQPQQMTVEKQASSIFQAIYKGEVTIERAIQMMRGMKFNAANPREQQVFASMVSMLFKEHPYLAKYPEKELMVTAQLFGQLINHGLMGKDALATAMHMVHKSIQPAPKSTAQQEETKRLFTFGVVALTQFLHTRLNEFPNLCELLTKSDRLQNGNPDIYGRVVQLRAAQQKGNGGNGGNTGGTTSGTTNGKGGTTSGSGKGGASEEGVEGKEGSSSSAVQVDQVDVPLVTIYINGTAFHPTSMEALLQKQHDASTSDSAKIAGLSGTVHTTVNHTTVNHTMKVEMKKKEGKDTTAGTAGTKMNLPTVEVPSDTVADRLNFIINNSTDSNITAKVREAREVLEPKFFKWLANQLVVKRICTQPNYHPTYLKFMIGLKMNGFEEAVLECTYENIRKLLSSDKIQTSTQDRSLLKNIGSWLGMITLARDRPVLARSLDLKELLYMAFEEGKLIAVAPFVAKVLEGCKSSTVFKPPNPWVIGLVRTLKEIYDVPDLKLNLKFEVEVLCKTLNLHLTRIEPSTYLQLRRPPSMQDNPDFNARAHQRAANEERERKIRAELEEKRLAELSGSGQMVAGTAPLPPRQGDEGGAAGSQPLPADTVIPNLAAYININESLILFQQTPSLKRVVPVAVDRAIRDIIQPVVERSVTIGVMTTRELITKDFAMEPDETKLRQAAHLMVSNLAGSLALVTCREPLRQSMAQHLRTLLAPSVQDQAMLEQVITQCSNDNLELGWRLIEKAATEKAMRDIDETLSNAIQIRRRHREQTGQKYYDTSIFTSGNRYPSALPPPLLPQPQPQGLSPLQLMVYENFKFMPRQLILAAQQQQGVNGVGVAQSGGQQMSMRSAGGNSSSNNFAPRGDGSLMKRALSTEPAEQLQGVNAISGVAMDTNQSLQGFFRCVTQLDHVMTQVAPQLQASGSPPVAVNQDTRVQQIMRAIAINYNRTSPAHRVEASHQFAHRVFNRTVERSNDPGKTI